MTDELANYDWFHRLLQLTGYAANIAEVNTVYTWRRMTANALNRPSVTVEDRKLLMGHSVKSKVFGAYLAKISQVDVQAVVTGHEEQRDVIEAQSHLSSSFDLPRCLSAKGRTAVFSRSDVQELSA